MQHRRHRPLHQRRGKKKVARLLHSEGAILREVSKIWKKLDEISRPCHLQHIRSQIHLKIDHLNIGNHPLSQ